MHLALSVLFDRHTVIFTASKPWSTLDPVGHGNHRNFLTLCDFHLLNLGDNMYINLTPREEERVFSTLPPGTTMSFVETNTPTETQYEFHYEITPPDVDNSLVNNTDTEDCAVLDYFPHRTPRTNPRNKQYVDVIDGYMERYAKALEYQTRPDTSHTDDGVASPSTSKSSYIHSNNTQSHRNVLLEDAHLHSSNHDESGNVIRNNNVNELNVLNVTSSNTEVESAICNNNVNELNVLNVTNINTELENAKYSVTSNNSNSNNSNNNNDTTSNNTVNTVSVNNENCIDNVNTKGVNGVISNNNDVSYPCEPTGTTSVIYHSEETNDINDSKRYSVITSDISEYDSDGSGTSSVSHTSADSSEGCTAPVLVRVTKDVHDCMTKKECVLLLPKLTTQTIEYWKRKVCAEDSVNTNSTQSGSSTPLLSADYLPWEDISDSNAKCNNILDNDMTNTVNKLSEKISTHVGIASTSTSDFEGFTEKDLPPDTSHGNTSGNKTSTTSPADVATDSSSASDSLINPRRSARPKKRKIPSVNYTDMCTNSQSDSDSASFTDTRQKPIKPLPGLVPSHSRITAQKLINKHRESKGSRTEFPEYSTDTNPNITDDEYDGDTEEYEVKPIPSPASMTIKTELTPESDTPKKRGRKTNTVPNANHKKRKKSMHPEPKPKPKVKVEPKMESPKIKLSKGGKSGEWHIKEFARVKYKKERKHKCPAVCNYSCNSTRLLNDHYRKSHPPIICKTCTKSFNNPSSYRRHSYWHKKSASSDMFRCNRCDYSCPFKSTLESHKDKHRRGYFFCFSAGCGKSFQRDSSLKAHVKLHNGKTIHCD